VKYNRPPSAPGFVGVSPCGKCNNKKQCRDNLLLCKMFRQYAANGGDYSESPGENPAAYLFDRLYKEDPISIKRTALRTAVRKKYGWKNA